jgi:hypothetical protein
VSSAQPAVALVGDWALGTPGQGARRGQRGEGDQWAARLVRSQGRGLADSQTPVEIEPAGARTNWKDGTWKLSFAGRYL